MKPDLSKIDPKRRCVPKTTGEHPGEWHEDGVSYIEQRTGRVMVSVRHLVTGDVSHVELSDVVFGVDAERWEADQAKAQALMVATKDLPQGEIGRAANLAGYNKADADRPKDRVGSPNKPLMRKVNGSCDSRPLQGIIACQNFESLSPVALDRGSNTSDPRRLTTGAPEQEPIVSGLVVTLPVMCAWCRLWRVDSVWTPTAPPNVSKVSHGICPPCAAKMLAEVAA